MSDLIERDKAIEAVLGLHTEHRVYWKDAVVDALKALPSAQPEIIRCKDCKNWDTSWQNDWAKDYHYCSITDGTHRGDWYCADAERRTDE